MCHATLVPCGKSCTVSKCHVAKTMPLQRFGGARDLFQTIFFYKAIFQTFFYKDENQNWPKLQGRKSCLSLYKIILILTNIACSVIYALSYQRFSAHDFILNLSSYLCNLFFRVFFLDYIKIFFSIIIL